MTSALLTLAAVHFVGLVVPGPNVLSVSQAAVAGSRPAALAVAFGVATAALIWATGAAAGLALALAAVHGLGIVLRIAGAVVLIVLGVRLVAMRGAVRAETADPREGLGRFFVKGVVVNLSNPKSLVYYTSVFMTLLPAGATPAVRVAAVAIVVGESVGWHSLLALLLSRKRPRRLYARLGGVVERTVGGAFVAIGGRLLWAATR
jgi:threonine efflux protein